MSDAQTKPTTAHTSHFGVYGAAIKDGQILLIRKSRGPYTGLLDLPGGTPEPHELLEETLRREVEEETGCEVTALDTPRAVSALYPYRSPDIGHEYTLRHLGALYMMKVRGEARMDLVDGDSSGADWYDCAKLLPYEITPFVKIAIK